MKIISLSLIIFLFSAHIFANEEETCRTIPKLESRQLDKLINSYEDIYHKLEEVEINHWGATTEQIKKSPCRKSVPTDKAIEEYINNINKNDKKISTTTAGIKFEDESPELIEIFQNLVSKVDIYGEREEAQLNIQNGYAINPKCKKVLCAAKKVFGNELGPKLIYLNQKFGLNGSQIAFNNSSKLRIKEIDRFISSIQDFPASFFPLNKNRQMTKFVRGMKPVGMKSNVIANSRITFFDSWLNLESKEMMDYASTHELAHYSAQELDLDNSPDWLSFSGWVEKDDNWSSSNKSAFVSGYAKTSPAEDFAESVATYRYNPKLLKKVSPEKYSFIKETVFFGLEYTSSTKCNPANSYENILKGLVSKDGDGLDREKLVAGEENIDSFLKSCKSQTMDFVLINGQENLENLDKCISNNIDTKVILDKIELLPVTLKYPELVKNKIQKFSKVTDLTSSDKHKEIHLEARRRVKDLVTDGFYEWGKRSDYLYSGFSENREPICDSLTRSAYQSLNDIDEVLGDQLASFRKAKQISKLMHTTCSKIHSEQKSPRPFLREEVERHIGINIYTDAEKKKEASKLEKELTSYKNEIKILEDKLLDNGFVFKAKNYLEYQIRIRKFKDRIRGVMSRLNDLNLEI